MRINLNFELESNIIIKEYRLAIISFIKHALENQYPNTYNALYKDNTKMKAFTFGVFLPNAKINDSSIEISKTDKNQTYINITFSIFDNELFIELYNSFNSMINKKYTYNNNSMIMTLRKITMLNEKAINKNKVLIKFLSPLILRNHNRETNKDIYLTFKDENFNYILNQSVERISKEFNFKSSEIKLITVKTTDEDGNTIKEESKTWKYNKRRIKNNSSTIQRKFNQCLFWKILFGRGHYPIKQSIQNRNRKQTKRGFRII